MLEQWLHLLDRASIRDPAEEPGADLLAAAIVEVGRALRRQNDTETSGPCSLEQVLQRLLARRLARTCRHEQIRLVDHEDRAELCARVRRRVAVQASDQMRDPRLNAIDVTEKSRTDNRERHSSISGPRNQGLCGQQLS